MTYHKTPSVGKDNDLLKDTKCDLSPTRCDTKRTSIFKVKVGYEETLEVVQMKDWYIIHPHGTIDV